MQQIGSNIMDGLKEIGKNFMPKSFTETSDTTQSADFSNAIENSITNLKSNNKNNKLDSLNLRVKQALHAIKKNTKNVEQHLKTSEDNAINTENLQEFDTLNIVESIIDNISSIKTPQELADKLKEKGISEDNISLIFIQLGLSEHTPYTPQNNITKEMPISDLTKKVNNPKASILNVESMQNSSNMMDKIAFGEKFEQTNLTKNTKPEVNDTLTSLSKEQTSLVNDANTKTINPEKTETNSKFQDLIQKFSEYKETTGSKLTSEEQAIVQQAQNKSKKAKTNLTPQELDKNSIAQKEATHSQRISEVFQQNSEVKNMQQDNKKHSETKEIRSQYKALKNKSSDITSEDSKVNSSEEHAKVQAFQEKIQTSEAKNEQANLFSNTKAENISASNDILTKNTSFESFVNEKSNINNTNNNLDLYKIAQEANVQNQINVAIRQFKSSDTKQIKLKLHPEELGNVNIELDVSNSTTKGIITVESPELAKHLAQNLKDIFQGFKNAGFEINDKNFEIKVDDQNQKQGQYNQNQKQAENERNDSNSKERSFSYSLQEDSLDIKV